MLHFISLKYQFFSAVPSLQLPGISSVSFSSVAHEQITRYRSRKTLHCGLLQESVEDIKESNLESSSDKIELDSFEARYYKLFEKYNKLLIENGIGSIAKEACL